MNTDNKRAAALNWWQALMSFDQDTYFKVYKEDNFTPAAGPHQLTGREIEIIWSTNHKVLLWLDDIRDPMKDDWLVFSPIPRENLRVIWVKSFGEFTNYIILNGMPDAICFDHDLGMNVAIEAREKGMSKRKSRELKKEEFTGYDAARWLVEYCMKYKHTLPKWNVQSANPVGKENINSYLNNYLKSLNT